MPKRKPKFHIKEIDDGVGKSRRAFFVINRIGFFFISWVLIKMRTKLFGWGGVHGWIMLLWL